MSGTYVALDLETTGLDADRDAIMEIGAVRFDLDGHAETFSTFVDPKRPVPYRIQRLTNISDKDLAGAPLLAEIAPELEAFVGEFPIVGQNIAFDLEFLERARIYARGPAYDTQELANVLLPGLVEQNLRAIARHLGIEFPVRHRALADAEAARLVFVALVERLAALPAELLAEAERIAASIDWPLQHLLHDVVEGLPRPADGASGAAGLLHGAVRPPREIGPPVGPALEEPSTIDPADIELRLTKSAREVIDDFEDRPEQVAMARAVTQALNDSEALLVEAGTGVGKSLAYLLPAAAYAQRNNKRVIVSTNTINLQAQLMNQDIPAVQRLLGGDNLRAAQLKGRRNYLCLLRWANLRNAPARTEEETRLLVRLLLWLPHTETGDRAELRLSQGEDAVWNRLSAQHEACLSMPCAFVRDGSCFLLRARKRAEAAHIVVVNHALLVSDLAVGGGVIPEYSHLIVDEAQHLEDEATRQFGFQGDQDSVGAFLDGSASLANSLRNASRGLASQLATTRDLLDTAARADDAIGRARQRAPEFFDGLITFMRQQSADEGDYDQRLSLNRGMRVQPDWGNVELAWENLSATLAEVVSALGLLQRGLQSPDAAAILDHDTLLSDTADLLQTGESLREGIGAIILKDDPNTVCWLTQQRSGTGTILASAPLSVAGLLEEQLFAQKDATILTGATLTTESSFDYVRGTLGLDDANELALGSPFDYAESTKVLVPRDMPEPSQNGYMAALQAALIDLVRASRGRALVLFTSHASLRAAHRGIRQALEDEQILVLGHNIDGSPRQLTQALRDEPNTVVLGTASFWEGVDIVGEALSLLVMARLPFSVPNDPIFRARSELYDDPFSQYAVPQAALRFKQGFGRLIRRKTDRGVMVVLDARITTRAYGQTFLHSLPPCTVETALLRQMPDLVSQWLGRPES
ncbi:MAG: 3'-5' exoribonuclease [Chloroflexi bacterium]|nr:3'-5' exoribonuclease [Chloroflexota bacterium]